MWDKLKIVITIAWFLLLLAVCKVTAEGLKDWIWSDRETAAAVSEEEKLIILDPGHGGMDVGKVGVNGEEEKEINLEIAFKIKKMLEESAISVRLTRNSDARLADTQKEDLRERVRIMNEEQPELVVSIHQNSYQEADVRGPQVFYFSNSNEGRDAAESVQAELNQLESVYSRKVKANSSYFILKNAEVPIIIVECGFLSNPEEAEKLTDVEYQESVAAAVTEGIQKYMESK